MLWVADQAVEHFLPWIDDRAGVDVEALDPAGKPWSFKMKCAASQDHHRRSLDQSCRWFLHAFHASPCHPPPVPAAQGHVAMRGRKHELHASPTCMRRLSDSQNNVVQTLHMTSGSAPRRFWMNGANPKRMYVLEGTREYCAAHTLRAGSTLSFYHSRERRLVRCLARPARSPLRYCNITVVLISHG